MNNKTITFATHEQYLEARHMADTNHEATLAWMRANKTNGIPYEIYTNFPYAKEVTNELRSAIEVYEFLTDPPINYFLYINEAKKQASTWMGDNLGRVTFGREYTSNMGDIRQAVSIWAINGKTYYGTYFKSSGNYARIKVRKTK